MSGALEINQYLSDARQLRESMRTNGRDFEFARRGRIIYFVDANIAGMFANPKRSSHELRVFANWLDVKLLLSTTTLAAEFIFSKKLPGQHDEPVYMTPDHYDDLQSMANGIRKKGTELTEKVNQSELASMKDRGNEINNLISNYQTGAVNAEVLLNRLGQLLPLAIMEMLVGPITEARQLRRLIEDSRLVRADSTRWFHGGLLEPTPALVADWVIRIQKAVNASSHDRSEANLFRDARSVVQLMNLSEEAPDDLKYIFVTTDLAIRSAYNRYFREEKAAGRSPVPINFRRPREFAPLLNLSSMSGHEEMYELFPRIERALDDLLVIKDLSGVIGDLDPEKLIANLQLWWSKAATTALTINSGYIAKREEANFRSIHQVLSEDDVVRAAIHQLRETIDHVSSAHLRLALGGIVGQYLTIAQERLLQEPGFLARRAPLQFKSEPFRDFIGETSINDYLNDLYRARAELPPLDKLVASKNVGLSFLFATCVALTAEDWRSASSLAEHAYSLITETKDEEVLDEARYCRAVSIRFVMKSKAEFESAAKLLEKCIRHSEKAKSHFGQLRATAEIASLYCVFFFRAKLVKRSGHSCEPADFNELWSRCSKLLEKASRMVDEISAAPKNKEYKLYERVILQIYAVRAALAIYEHWIGPGGGRISENDRRRHRKELTELERAISEWNGNSNAADAPYTAQVYAGVLKFILADGDQERAKARSGAEHLLQRLLKFEKLLLDFDREGFKFFLNRISPSVIE